MLLVYIPDLGDVRSSAMVQVSSTEEFVDLVRRSGLIEERQLSRFLADVAAEADGELPEAQEALAERMVRAAMITSWQAEKLLDGKHRGFFLGKYKLLDHLGKGGMSNVYLAEHLLMQRRVAIKVLPPERVEDKSYLSRFQQEARAAARLDHPNIVHAYDVDHTGKTHYLVMEYVEGKDLHVFVNDTGPMDYELAADFILQAARGLAHAHEAGLIHRDIKPANLLVDQKKTVKVLDMGLAKFSESEEPSLTLAHEESVLGTADYLPPEQALHSHAADHRSDIYSLGCTLYFLLTGHPPFNQGSIRERLLKHQVETPPSIYKDRPDAPPGLVNICNRMMSKKPENRYQSAEEVAQALSGWLQDRGYEAGGPGASGGLRRPDGLAGSSDFGIGRLARAFPVPTQASMDTASGAGRDTSRIDDEEEIGLAPIEDEVATKRKPPSEGLSGSDILGRRETDAEEVARPSEPASLSDSTKSLLEEELEELPANVSHSGVNLPSHSGVRNPRLGPASHSSEEDSTHAILIWLLVGAGTIIAILLLLGVLNMQ
jgi:serine/threonine protein kinase